MKLSNQINLVHEFLSNYLNKSIYRLTQVEVMKNVGQPNRLSCASSFGEDQYGFWSDVVHKESVQRFRWVCAGTFLMGCADNEPECIQSVEVQHEVTLTKGFWISDTTVTQKLWQEFVGSNPSRFKGSDLPVDSISWDDASEFLEKLKERLDQPLVSLPTEAQWEYACRAGASTPFSFGEYVTSEQVNCDGTLPYNNSPTSEDRRTTIDAKTLPPNSWGLYGMHGNVWEWCLDWYEDDYSKLSSIDPQGASLGYARSLRGGSWFYGAQHCRSSTRGHDAPDSPGILLDYGFRVVINI